MKTSEQIYNTYLTNNTNKFYYPYYKNEVIEIFDYIFSHITYTEEDMYMWTHDCTDDFIEHQYDIYEVILPLCISINKSVKQLPSFIKNMFYELKTFCISTCHNHFYFDNESNFEWGYEDPETETVYVGHIFKRNYLLYTPLKDLSYMYRGSARVNTLLNKPIPNEQISRINDLYSKSDNINHDECINDILKLYIYCVCLGFQVKDRDVKKIKKLYE